ncbi:glutamine synthetase 1, mitochondrial-like [Plodia interpunctella]|uniref:glutamine synthetase 1, mitochondrial-like n=1 Tax=Plodia interpunctella TaxID=58824 RepID=UPI0023686ACC|nr:glutamine synthetase 1, mitochondrial-like [Plodia interpunctella]
MFKVVKLLTSYTPSCKIIQSRSLMKHNINHIISKKIIDRYLRLPWPCNKVLATYFWIDGSGINMRCKDRILNCVPYSAEVAPGWAFDGSSTGQATTDKSDTRLQAAAVYRDPFRMEPHVIVLAEVYLGDGDTPAPTNHRKKCYDLCEAWAEEEPWFGLEQEYTMLDVDGWGLGWPKGGGFPAVKYQYSYCGVGAKYIAGREVSEAHARACLYAGLDFEGTNAEVMYACWEWQIGTTVGIKAPDDLWASRFIMSRVAEEYGVDITYHPKPMGALHPGVGMHHNFSTKRMRSDGGYQFIEECIKKLEQNHMKHMKVYGNDEATNRMRLSGRFETAPFEKFSWGVASRAASVRVQRSVKQKGKGFFEDRRPAGDCDPYLVCGLLMETCLGSGPSGGGGKGNPCKK